MAIDTADTVKHEPTGETWIVAYVEDGRLAWCGWPPGLVPVSECTLVEKATPEDRDKLLREMADMPTSDHRKRYAERRLTPTPGAPHAPRGGE